MELTTSKANFDHNYKRTNRRGGEGGGGGGGLGLHPNPCMWVSCVRDASPPGDIMIINLNGSKNQFLKHLQIKHTNISQYTRLLTPRSDCISHGAVLLIVNNVSMCQSANYVKIIIMFACFVMHLGHFFCNSLCNRDTGLQCLRTNNK